MQLDQHLVIKIQKGDAHSLKQVVKSSLNTLYRVSFKITGDPSLSRKVILLVYKQIWEHRENLDPYRQLGPLLMREVYLQSMKEMSDSPNVNPGLAQLASGDDRAKYVAENLNRGDGLNSMLFLLFFVDGLDFRDLSLMTKLDETDVETRIGSVMSSLDNVYEQ